MSDIETDDTPPAGKWSGSSVPENHRPTAVLRAARKAGSWWMNATTLVKAVTALVATLGTTAIAVAALWPSISPMPTNVTAVPVPAISAPDDLCLGDACGPEFLHRDHWHQTLKEET